MKQSHLSLALSVVEPTFFLEEGIFWDESDQRSVHSMHSLLSLPDSCSPDLPAYFIKRYSKKGDLICDPFCGSGSTGFEAVSLGRRCVMSDLNPFLARLSSVKLQPCDLAEVTMWLQMVSLRRPINLEIYRERFAPFYDVDTFRELVNLRHAVHQDDRPVARFVELLAVSLLHGHSAGYFSVYSLPQFSLTPADQDALNARRNQRADYRAVVPRLLRRAASVLRDGVTSNAFQLSKQSSCGVADARNLAHIPAGSVNLTVTQPPLPCATFGYEDLWLRYWFSNFNANQVPDAFRRKNSDELYTAEDIATWREFMNESLVELARVTARGGRAVLSLSEVRVRNAVVPLDEELFHLVEQQLSRFWDCECTLVQKEVAPQLKDSKVSRNHMKVERGTRMLVLRRR